MFLPTPRCSLVVAEREPWRFPRGLMRSGKGGLSVEEGCFPEVD